MIFVDVRIISIVQSRHITINNHDQKLYEHCLMLNVVQ